jgi:hypothetical protein
MASGEQPIPDDVIQAAKEAKGKEKDNIFEVTTEKRELVRDEILKTLGGIKEQLPRDIEVLKTANTKYSSDVRGGFEEMSLALEKRGSHPDFTYPEAATLIREQRESVNKNLDNHHWAEVGDELSTAPFFSDLERLIEELCKIEDVNEAFQATSDISEKFSGMSSALQSKFSTREETRDSVASGARFLASNAYSATGSVDGRIRSQNLKIKSGDTAMVRLSGKAATYREEAANASRAMSGKEHEFLNKLSGLRGRLDDVMQAYTGMLVLEKDNT